MLKKQNLYDRIKEPYRKSIIDSLDSYPRGASRVIEVLRTNDDIMKLTLEEILDIGTFAFDSGDSTRFTQRSQHSVYAFCEQFFEPIETQEPCTTT